MQKEEEQLIFSSNTVLEAYFQEDPDPEQKWVTHQAILDELKIVSFWDLFCDCLIQNNNFLQIQNLSAKGIITSHFIDTQNQRPEFIFHLILIYLQENKIIKVQQLIE